VRNSLALTLVLLLGFSLHAAALTTQSTASNSFYVAPTGGAASVTSFHSVTVTQLSSSDLLLTLGMKMRMFYNGSILYNQTVIDSQRLANSQGFLMGSLLQQGACLLIEGSYSSRTDGGAGVPPVLFINSIGVSGIVVLNCPPIIQDPGECGSSVTQTSTTFLQLGGVDAGGRDLTAPSVEYPLSRSESRGSESFVMEEFAVVADGEVISASEADFSRAVLDQNAVRGGIPVLVVQEPNHVRNSRYIPKPSVRLLGDRVPTSQRSDGGIVAARIEFSAQAEVDEVEVIYSSQKLDREAVARLLSRRVGLAFVGDKGHRTEAYVVFRVTNRLELLGAITVLPQCCCGETFCV